MTHEGISISVVIPSTSRVLPQGLREAIAKQTLPAAEIIHVYDQQRNGAAWARNCGIERASGEVIACIDDDCVPPTNWLESIIDAMRRYGADVVGGTYEERDPFLYSRRSRQHYPLCSGPDTKGHVGAGGNIAYRSSVLHRAKSAYGFVFNESFRISQDWELMWRLRDLGANVVFLSTRVRHEKSIGCLSYIKQQFFRGVGIAGLDRARRQLKPGLLMHESLLWSNPGASLAARAVTLIWEKGFGPFGRKQFNNLGHYLLFWIGDKAQCLGYLWGRVRQSNHRGLEQASWS